MRTLEELVDLNAPAMPLVRQWLSEAHLPFEILPANANSGDVLVGLQVTTRSPMGAITYETGGILVDNGWLRILGSGHPKLPRNIVEWNINRASGHQLVADDAIGGFFSINGGALGPDQGSMYYWAPDTLDWESMGIGYSEFLCWALSDRLAIFYENLRWAGWERDAQQICGDQCFNFYPPLWTAQGTVVSSFRKAINVAEQFSFNASLAREV